MGTDAVRITVVVPVWDSYVRFLAEAIASVHAGGMRTRILVVDNASEPPVPRLHGCEVIRSEQRLTVGGSRNFALPHIDTEYVLFLDADDLLIAGALAHLCGGLGRHPTAAAVVGGILEPDGTRHRVPRRICRLLARAPKLLAWADAVWSLVPAQGTLMRTAHVRAVGGYADATGAEDWALVVSLAFRSPIAFISEPAMVYRLRHDSPGMSGLTVREMRRNAARVRQHVQASQPQRPARLAALTAAQLLALYVGRPIVIALRGLRGAGQGPRRHAGGDDAVRYVLDHRGPGADRDTLAEGHRAAEDGSGADEAARADAAAAGQVHAD